MAFVFTLVLTIFFLLYCKGGLLIAEVMASKGFKVQPPPRVPRHDTVQVCISVVCLHYLELQHSNGLFLDESFRPFS